MILRNPIPLAVALFTLVVVAMGISVLSPRVGVGSPSVRGSCCGAGAATAAVAAASLWGWCPDSQWA